VVKIRVVFESGEPERVIEVDLARAPFQHDGKPGSILDVLVAHGVPLEHACGGNCACTTCHVIVKEGAENISEMQEDEEDRLDTAVGLTIRSRLGCQAVVHGDVVVEVPES
jgi:ferredoxin, 2Fe-2S